MSSSFVLRRSRVGRVLHLVSATTGGNEDDGDEDVEGTMNRGRKDRYAPIFFSSLFAVSLFCLLFFWWDWKGLWIWGERFSECWEFIKIWIWDQGWGGMGFNGATDVVMDLG